MQVKGFTLRPGRLEDAAWFAPRLRESDRVEVQAVAIDLEACLRASIEASEICMVAERQGRGVILLGCVPAPDGAGIPWLLATDEVRPFPGALTAIGKRYVALFLERWPRLINAVDERNTVSIRWLQRLGFTIGEPQPFGLAGEPFRVFTMEA